MSPRLFYKLKIILNNICSSAAGLAINGGKNQFWLRKGYCLYEEKKPPVM